MPKVLFFDIETAPNLAYVWQHYDANVLAYESEWYILCFSYKWENEGPVQVVAIPDFDTEMDDDSGVVQVLWDLLDEADIVVAHNGDKFDLKKANSRFVIHGLGPPSSYATVDTLKVARKHFNFNSNKLGDLGKTLKLGVKAQTGGFETWLGCMRGDPKAWAKMIKYAKQDTVLLEKVYLTLRPFMTNHPNRGIEHDGEICPTCGSTDLASNGIRHTQTMHYRRLVCQKCGANSKGRLAIPDSPKPEVVP